MYPYMYVWKLKHCPKESGGVSNHSAEFKNYSYIQVYFLMGSKSFITKTNKNRERWILGFTCRLVSTINHTHLLTNIDRSIEWSIDRSIDRSFTYFAIFAGESCLTATSCVAGIGHTETPILTRSVAYSCITKKLTIIIRSIGTLSFIFFVYLQLMNMCRSITFSVNRLSCVRVRMGLLLILHVYDFQLNKM